MRHLRNELSENALQLGLNTISDAYIDNDDGHAKSRLFSSASSTHTKFPPAVTLTPSRSVSHTSRPHAILVAVDLCYIWKTAGDREDSTDLLSDASPFADNLYLPFELLLKRITEQLFNQLVGRYPLIFGTWCRRLDMESEYFPSVAQSILEIMQRSPNPHFITRCKRLIKTARARHQSVLHASAAALSLCFVSCDSEDSDKAEQINISKLTPEAVLCESLEQIFRAGVPQTRFKVIAARSALLTSSAGNDDQLIEDDAIFDNSEIDFPLAWPNLPDIHMDNSVPVIDIQQTVPNDMGDLLEDWPEEALTWSTFSGAWTTHSDDSLIEGPGSSSQPRSTTPPLAWSYLSESEDDSFALDPAPDHEQEDANMEDAEFAHANNLEEWMTDVFDDSGGLGVEDETGSIAVSQVPDGGPDQDNFFQVKNNTADQEYDFDTHFGMDGQVVQGSADCFTDVWDL
ncbi:hypothetical protein EDD22DRAFT_968373 [Suillus occidentalis]|nr:hypothetical protein EDD22DRAFT_968373 [Suillus occidentalis]